MGSDSSGNAYALTVLSPIKQGHDQNEIAYADIVRDRLEDWNFLPNSPMALVPNTYLCRYFVLDDVYTESLPGGTVLDTLVDLLPIVQRLDAVLAEQVFSAVTGPSNRERALRIMRSTESVPLDRLCSGGPNIG